MSQQSRPIRTLLVHRFYEPDSTTYARMLGMIGRELADAGLGVTVFSTQPSYNNSYDGPSLPGDSIESGVRVLRRRIPGGGSSAGRLGGGVVFCLLLLWHVAQNRRAYDIVMVSTVPPVLMGVTGRIASRIANARFVYHCMDIYPEIALSSGLLNEGWMASFARHLDSWSMRGAANVIVLSDDMEQTVRRRADDVSITVRNNFSIGAAVPLPTPPDPGTFRLIFAGNLGRFQGLELLLEGFADFVSEGGRSARLTFLGHGVLRERLEEHAKALGVADCVEFPGHVSYEEAATQIAESNVAIVTLSPRLIGAAFPSKTITYLEQGSRILAVVESSSSLAAMIRTDDLGTVAEPGDRAGIAAAMAAEYDRPWTPVDAARAQTTATSLFSTDEVLALWPRIIANANGAINDG